MLKYKNICIYEDEYCYYVWKPAGVPSTFGKEESFIESIFFDKNSTNVFIENQLRNFTKDEEFGLLNRLDNDTSGLLYFAKTRDIKERYKNEQKKGGIEKFYVLDVYGDIRYRIKEYGNIISFPITHHKFLDDRMVVIKTDEDMKKGKANLHYVKTKILEYERNKENNISTIIVMIQKGIRHQIRSHLSSIGYPIVGDVVYGKKKDPLKGCLHLYSIGLKINKI